MNRGMQSKPNGSGLRLGRYSYQPTQSEMRISYDSARQSSASRSSNLSLTRSCIGSAVCVLLCLCLCMAGVSSKTAAAQNATYSGLQTTLVTGLEEPTAVAVDKAGDVYYLDAGDGSIRDYVPGNQGGTYITGNLTSPSALAVDGVGNLYVGTGQNPMQLLQISTVNQSQTVFATGLGSIGGIAVDGQGNVYVSDFSANVVRKLPAGGGPGAVLSTPGVKQPYALAIDAAGDLFIGDINADDVVEVPAAGGALVTVATGIVPNGLAVDVSGNLFILTEATQGIYEVPAGSASSATPTQLTATGFDIGAGIAVDNAGNLYVADSGNNRLVEFQTRTAYLGTANVCAPGTVTPTPCNQTIGIPIVTGHSVFIGPPTFVATVVTEGAANQDFVLSGQSCTPHGKLDQDCTFNVTFAPSAPGARRGALQISTGAGTPILLTVPLAGYSYGAQIVFDSNAQSTVAATGLTHPTAVKADTAGDLFIVDADNNRIVEMPAGGGAQTTVNTGTETLDDPVDVAVDGAGNLFIADFGNSRVLEVAPGGLTVTTVASGIGASGIAVDGNENVFVSDYPNNRVVEYSTAGGSGVVVATAADSVRGPRGLAVDTSEGLYIASSGNATVLYKSLSGLPVYAVGTGWSSPYGVAIDPTGDVYVADTANTGVVEVVSFNHIQLPLESGLTNPAGVAVGDKGDLFVADYGANKVVSLPRSQIPSLSFAPTQVGSTSTDSPQTITVQNIGNVGLDLTQIAYPADFPRASVSSGDYACSTTTFYSYGEPCSIAVSFTPTKAGVLSESLTINDNVLNGPGMTQSIALNGTGTSTAGPAAKLSATSLSFPSTAVGSTSTLALTITNSGTGTLSVSAISNTGTNPTDFTHTSNCGGNPLAAGASCTAQVSFTPAAAGSFSATLNITDNGSGSPQTVTLTGTAVAGPVARLSATSLSFPSTTVGSTSTLALTITNSGVGNLSVSAIGNTGTNPTSFTHTSNCGGNPLAAGASCTAQVSFTPAAAGSFSATLNITDNASGSPQKVTMTGTGTAVAGPMARLSATSLSFPSTAVGSTSTLALTITNSGTGSLSVSAISQTGSNASDFSHTSNCGGNALAAGKSCTAQVTFTPAAAGTFSATLNITDNATGSPQTVSLSGTGSTTGPVAKLSATSLSFPSTSVGSTSTLALTITNSGGATLTVSAIGNTGANPTEFTHTSNCGGNPLAAGASCTAQVSFTPAAAGSFSATLNITDNATGSPQQVTLTGTGH
jgi:sugar lactone lactonase YvrE